MLHDADFTETASVDRYGRRIPKGAGRQKMQRLYTVTEKENGTDEGEDDENVQQELNRLERKYDPARDGGFSESSSDEETEDDNDEPNGEDGRLEDGSNSIMDDAGGKQGQQNEVTLGDASSRLAVVNLDWDNIRAVDLMAVGSSFCPPGGQILNVTVYPSEFGRERMEREQVEGPPSQLFLGSSKVNGAFEEHSLQDSSPAESDDDDEKIKSNLLDEAIGSTGDIDSHALRAYQLSRLRYYYAIIICDTPSTALALYKDMDGRDYLSTANCFDLRFVPDSVTFDDPVIDKPRDQCQKVPEAYRPNEFVTDALTHSKVTLTWDEEDKERKEVQKRAFSRNELDANDLKAYVGSDSEDDEELDDEIISKTEVARQKIRAALGLSAEPAASKTSGSKSKADNKAVAPVGGMQITFTAGLTSQPTRPSVFENRPEDVYEETTQEKYIRKERERKARRKAKKTSAAVDDNVDPNRESVQTKQPLEAPLTKVNEEENGFDDHFFTDPAAANKAARQEAKRAKRYAAAAEVEASAARKQRERKELELLMVGDGRANAEHFDMAEVKKAEEKRRKGKKKGKRHGGEEEAGKEVDGFEMDVEDSRFKDVYEDHEFAIDPSNPRFSGTEGMRKILEEGRRKRKRRDGEGMEEVRGPPRRRDVEERNVSGDEINELVAKMKRRKAV